MNVLYLNTFGTMGGAAVAARRAMQAVKLHGVQAQMVSTYKPAQDDIMPKPSSDFIRKAIMAADVFAYTLRAADKKQKFTFSPARFGLPVHKLEQFRQSDIIHLHWITQGFISLRGLKKIFSSGKPIVWTPHDQWVMTGGCYYPGQCEGYFSGCYNCPKLKGKSNFWAASLFIRKSEIYPKAKLHFIAISSWMKYLLRNSPLTADFPVTHIPNPIDIEQYKPMDRDKIKSELGLDVNKKYVGFVAFNVKDPRKGANYLFEALKILAQSFSSQQLGIIVVGKLSKKDLPALPFEIVTTGYISSAEQMVKYYNAMDLFVIPSLQDNLPNTVMESLACGTPVVGFNVGGIPDMVEHKINGFLAWKQSAEQIAQGITWVLTNQAYPQLRENARTKVVNNFSYSIVGKQLADLYAQMLKQ